MKSFSGTIISPFSREKESLSEDSDKDARGGLAKRFVGEEMDALFVLSSGRALVAGS